MNNKNKYPIGIFFLVISGGACGTYSASENTADETTYFTSSDPPSDFKNMNWLVGSWRGMYEGKPFYEAWRQPHDSVLVNYSIEIKGSDTLIQQAGTIHLRGRNLFLGTDSVYWKLSTFDAGEIIFKNDTLPYSRTIYWRHTPEDHWYTKLTHPNDKISEYDLEKQPELDTYVTEFLNNNQQKK